MFQMWFHSNAKEKFKKHLKSTQEWLKFLCGKCSFEAIYKKEIKKA